MGLRRVRLDIEYDGTDFAGWQTQPRQSTIQGELERALRVALRRSVRIVGAGRTDAGVHAKRQVAHADIPADSDLARLRATVNALTPSSIALLAVRPVSHEFHARRSAVARTYLYRLACRPVAYGRTYVWSLRQKPVLARMRACAEALPGVHDFASFCVARSAPKGTDCRILEASWRSTEGEYRFHVSANRFVHGMVRSLVGAMVEVGLNRMNLDDFRALLAGARRRGTGPTAPPCGLCLIEVVYGDGT